MKKKAIAIAVASALVTPASLAAQDTGGMQYTSASEGFYGSIRARINSGAGDNNTQVQNSGSRVGISGTHDLGRGLSGFYTWEIGTPITSGEACCGTRIGRVGLKGDFGQAQAGSFWTFSYNNVTSATDQANINSGNFQGGLSQTRSKRSIEYTTPDFNGFQSALLLQFDGGDGTGLAEDLDQWNIAGAYSVQGFTFGASYNVWANGLPNLTYNDADAAVSHSASNAASAATADKYDESKALAEDKKAWALRGSYSQDNWVVNMIYGADNRSDQTISGGALSKFEDNTFLEFHAGVDINKTSLYAVYAVKSDVNGKGNVEGTTGQNAVDTLGDDTQTAVGVVYRFTAKSRAFLEYANQDLHSDTKAEGYAGAGLRFDF